MAARTALLVALFAVVAGSLGPAEFGMFSAVLAVYGLASSLCSTGIGIALVQRVALGRDGAGQAAGAALQAAVVSGLVLLLPATALLKLVLLPGSDWTLLLAVGVAELVFLPVVEVCGRAFQASGTPFLLPGLSALMVGLRLAFLGAWWLLTENAEPLTAREWGLLYAGAGAMASALALALVARRLRLARGDGLGDIIGAGAPIGLTFAAARANADADKALLARLADVGAAGWYTAAYRVVDLVVLPVQALLEATLPRFFAAGAAAREDVQRQFRRVLRAVAAIGLAGGAGLYALASAVPAILGEAYGGSVPMLQALCAMPALVGIRWLLRQVLLGRGHTRLYPAFEVAGAVTNVGLNVILIPGMGWMGAVISSYSSEALMVLLSAAAAARRRAA